MNRFLAHATKMYKSPRAILTHARAEITDRDNWTQRNLQLCQLPAIGFRPLGEEFTAEDARKANAKCRCCALGAALYFTADEVLDKTIEKMVADDELYDGETAEESDIAYYTPAAQLLDKAANELYGKADPQRQNVGIIGVNDGLVHKTASGAHKATLRVFDRAIELAS